MIVCMVVLFFFKKCTHVHVHTGHVHTKHIFGVTTHKKISRNQVKCMKTMSVITKPEVYRNKVFFKNIL